MEKQPRTPKEKAAQSREDRLKAALKANLGRRKAQARARASEDVAGQDGDTRSQRGSDGQKSGQMAENVGADQRTTSQTDEQA